jgi:hypothetical protein
VKDAGQAGNNMPVEIKNASIPAISPLINQLGMRLPTVKAIVYLPG